MTIRLEHGDCLDVMDRLAAEGIMFDAFVSDPPYHLTSIVDRLGSPDAAPIQSGATGVYARSSGGFMGQKWDGGDIAFRVETWRKVYSLLKPGAHLVAFSATRSYHRMVCAIEDAGFEIRDMVAWLYGTGFPKSHNLDGEWEGWGSALKPAHEPIVLARKPLMSSIPANVSLYGTGALNIDGCRIHGDDAPVDRQGEESQDRRYGDSGATPFAATPGRRYTVKRLAPGATVNATGKWKSDEIYEGVLKDGRWPANVAHDGSDEVVSAFPDTPGALAPVQPSNGRKTNKIYGNFNANNASEPRRDDGSAARFFYSAKATDGERVMRCTICGDHRLGKPKCAHDPQDWTSHPTVKPIALMRWLVRLITPPGGLILDPFAGTGTTGAAAIAEDMQAVLIEQDDDYVADINVRLGTSITNQVKPRPRAMLDAGPLFGPSPNAVHAAQEPVA